MGFPFLAVAAWSMPSLNEDHKQSLRLIAEEIVKKQQPDGSWEFFATLRRPPINESQTTDAVWIILWLVGNWNRTCQNRRMRRLRKQSSGSTVQRPLTSIRTSSEGADAQIRSAKPRDSLQTTIDELLALHLARPRMEPDRS